MCNHKMKILTVIIFTLAISASFSHAQVCSPTPSGIVAWYAADGNANDISGNGNHGTMQNDATFAAGKVGQAFSFDGADDFVNIPDSASLDSLTTTVSFEAWINPQTPTGVQGVLFARRNPFSSESFTIGVDSGGELDLILGTTANGTVAFFTPAGTVQFGQWQHIAVTVNTTTGARKAYVNGQEVTFTPYIGSTISGQLNSADNHFIGQRQSANPEPRHYKGLIDEAAIYNRELSASEIQAIFNAGTAGKCKSTAAVCTPPPSGTAAWYAADGNANDISGNGNHGTMQNGATFAAGKVGQAFSFDGVDDFVQLPASASLEPDSITIEGWINPQTPNGTDSQYIYAARTPLVTESFSVGISSSGAFGVEISTPSSPFTGSVFATAANTIQFGTLQHVALSYNADNGTLAAYINGSAVTLNHIQGPSSVSGGLRKNVDHFIGRRQSSDTPEGVSPAAHFKGLIDELSIYNRALSASEIAAIFNAGSAGKCKSVVTAVSVSVSGRVLSPQGRGVARARVFLTGADGFTRSALTNNFGYYRFEQVEIGQTYLFNVFSKKFQFAPQVITINEETENLNFSPDP